MAGNAEALERQVGWLYRGGLYPLGSRVRFDGTEQAVYVRLEVEQLELLEPDAGARARR